MKRTEKTIDAQQYRPGDVVIVQDIPKRKDREDGPTLGTRIARIQSLRSDGRVRIALRIGSHGGRSGGCRFSPHGRTIEASSIVRLASRREISIGAISFILPMAVCA